MKLMVLLMTLVSFSAMSAEYKSLAGGYTLTEGQNVNCSHNAFITVKNDKISVYANTHASGDAVVYENINGKPVWVKESTAYYERLRSTYKENQLKRGSSMCTKVVVSICSEEWIENVVSILDAKQIKIGTLNKQGTLDYCQYSKN